MIISFIQCYGTTYDKGKNRGRRFHEGKYLILISDDFYDIEIFWNEKDNQSNSSSFAIKRIKYVPESFKKLFIQTSASEIKKNNAMYLPKTFIFNSFNKELEITITKINKIVSDDLEEVSVDYLGIEEDFQRHLLSQISFQSLFTDFLEFNHVEPIANEVTIPTTKKRIDILGIDELDNSLLILELKAPEAGVSAVDQILGYKQELENMYRFSTKDKILFEYGNSTYIDGILQQTRALMLDRKQLHNAHYFVVADVIDRDTKLYAAQNGIFCIENKTAWNELKQSRQGNEEHNVESNSTNNNDNSNVNKEHHSAHSKKKVHSSAKNHSTNSTHEKTVTIGNNKNGNEETTRKTRRRRTSTKIQMQTDTKKSEQNHTVEESEDNNISEEYEQKSNNSYGRPPRRTHKTNGLNNKNYDDDNKINQIDNKEEIEEPQNDLE